MDIRQGKLYVNGEEMEEPYIERGNREEDRRCQEFPYTVEDGKLFVMGDNREESMDSRDFGAVIRKQIKGKVLLYIGRIS